MNIKSLLFGSAAALVAVTGARAADAVVVAEPEPVEYVRVCDTYGTGFYYIPGTETCLRISGLVRYDVDWNDKDPVTTTTTTVVFGLEPDAFPLPLPDEGGDAGLDLDDFDPQDVSVTVTTTTTTVYGLDQGWAKTITARLNIDARTETEWGTFRRFIRLSGSFKSGLDTGPVEVIYAYIELGGLLIGAYDTLYDGGLSPEFDVNGGTTAHQIRYTFNGANGLSIAGSIEVQSYNVTYTPNVVVRVGLSQAWGAVALFGAYDAITEEFGGKAIVSFNATDRIMIEAMGIWESGPGDFSVGYEGSAAGAVSFKASDMITIRGGGQYFWNKHTTTASGAAGNDDWIIGANVDITPVPDLLVRFQVARNGGDSPEYTSARMRVEGGF